MVIGFEVCLFCGIVCFDFRDNWVVDWFVVDWEDDGEDCNCKDEIGDWVGCDCDCVFLKFCIVKGLCLFCVI